MGVAAMLVRIRSATCKMAALCCVVVASRTPRRRCSERQRRVLFMSFEFHSLAVAASGWSVGHPGESRCAKIQQSGSNRHRTMVAELASVLSDLSWRRDRTRHGTAGERALRQLPPAGLPAACAVVVFRVRPPLLRWQSMRAADYRGQETRWISPMPAPIAPA
jgi:hypothetical protein